MRNSIRHLYDDEKVTFGELLMKARQNEDEEVLAKVISKSVSVNMEIKDRLEEKVDKLLAAAKSSQYNLDKGKRDSGQTPKQTPYKFKAKHTNKKRWGREEQSQGTRSKCFRSIFRRAETHSVF